MDRNKKSEIKQRNRLGRTRGTNYKSKNWRLRRKGLLEPVVYGDVDEVCRNAEI